MKAKRKSLSIILTLIIIANTVLPWMQTTVLAATTNVSENTRTFTLSSNTFYNSLKKSLSYGNNSGALLSSSDADKTVTLNMSKITLLYIDNVNMTNSNSRTVFQTLLQDCPNLSTLGLNGCDLSQFDLSILNTQNTKESLKVLYLIGCQIDKAPDLTLPNLQALYLSKNDLSADGACDNLTKTKLPQVTRLGLDDCNISDINFINNMGNLTTLYLGDNYLTDDSITELIDMSSKNLSGLKRLNLGKTVYTYSGESHINLPSSNSIKDIPRLISLLTDFPMLEFVDLSYLGITSLQEFTHLKDGIEIDFTRNAITDFAGLESNGKFNLNFQDINLSGNYAAGWESDLPELLKRILDENDVLKGTLTYNFCHLSDDGTKIVIEPDSQYKNVSVKVTSGKLD